MRLLSIFVVLALAVSTVSAQTAPPDDQFVCANTDVVIVMDRSGSMAGSKLATAQAAAKDFVDMLTAGDQSGLVSFASSSSLDQELTTDGTAVKTAIDGLTATGTTCITCGINTAQAEIDANGRNDASHVIVLLSDGEPVGDTVAAAQAAADAAKGAGTYIFTIAIPDANQALMQSIASSPNAPYYNPGTVDDLSVIYEEIRNEICEGPNPEVPEFGVVGATLALLGAGYVVYRKRK